MKILRTAIKYPAHRRPILTDDLSDPQLLARVARFYAHRLRHVPTAQAALHRLGVGDPALWDAFQVGLHDTTLASVVPPALHVRLQAMGLVAASTGVLAGPCWMLPLSHPRRGITGFIACPIDGGPEVRVDVSPGGFLNAPALAHRGCLFVLPGAIAMLRMWQADRRAVTCLERLPESLEDLKPLLALSRASELRFCGFPEPRDPVAFSQVLNDLQVRGIHLTCTTLDAVDPAGPLPVTTDLDLALWRRRFTDHLVARGFAATTIADSADELRRFFVFLHQAGLQALSELTPRHMDAYRTSLFYARHVRYPDRPLSLSTQANRLGVAQRFTRFLADAHWLLADPGAGVPAVRVRARLPSVRLSEDDVRALLLGQPIHDRLGLRNRAMLELFYATAMRNSELCRLTLDSIDFARRDVAIRRGKGDKSRWVPLGREAARWLTLYLDQVRPALLKDPAETTLFLSVRGRPFEAIGMGALVRRMASAAGLAQRITPHLLRHACATHMLHRGAGLRHLQELLGHASPDTTQRYTRVDVADLMAVYLRCHPREQGATR